MTPHNELKEAVKNVKQLTEKCHPKGLKSREYLELPCRELPETCRDGGSETTLR
ncbi:MAG: hypothetical protein ACTSQI_21760 [Candidatus Helarchaeota archaeon]